MSKSLVIPKEVSEPWNDPMWSQKIKDFYNTPDMPVEDIKQLCESEKRIRELEEKMHDDNVKNLPSTKDLLKQVIESIARLKESGTDSATLEQSETVKKLLEENIAGIEDEITKTESMLEFCAVANSEEAAKVLKKYGLDFDTVEELEDHWRFVYFNEGEAEEIFNLLKEMK